jgi:phospholipase/carboxylesterase
VEAHEHQGSQLKYLTVHPDNYDPNKKYPMIIMLHGFGANMQDLAGVAPVLHPTGYVYAFPNAPEAMELAPGMIGYSWTHPERRRDPEEDAKTRVMLNEFFREVMEQYNVEPGNVVLGGFSQGGRMAYACGLGKPDLFAGIMALSAAVFDTDPLLEQLPAERTQPVFIAHGDVDMTVAVDQARMTKAFLESEGYQPVYNEYPMGHEISRSLLSDMTTWLKDVLPPLG